MKTKPTKAKIDVRGTEITVIRREKEDYISLTDIAKSRNPGHPDDLIRNWVRNRNTLELLGIWEQPHNPASNPVEFDGLTKQAGLKSYKVSVEEWLQKTHVIGLRAAFMGEPFDHSKKIISEHLQGLFEGGELDENSVVRNFRTTAADGKSYSGAWV
jgi:hypothetical protein